MSDDGDNVVDLHAAKKPDKRKQPWSAERKAAWREKVAKSNNKPAAGNKASGLPAMGPGWGGPAKGPGRDWSQVRQLQRAPGPTNAELQAVADEALATMVEVMRDPESPPGLKLIAGEKVRAQIVGTPVQRTLTAETGPADLLGALMEISRDRDAG